MRQASKQASAKKVGEKVGTRCEGAAGHLLGRAGKRSCLNRWDEQVTFVRKSQIRDTEQKLLVRLSRESEGRQAIIRNQGKENCSSHGEKGRISWRVLGK